MERLDCDRMLVAVLEMGSFAAAAARLGTSSGQASKMISCLEACLGGNLSNAPPAHCPLRRLDKLIIIASKFCSMSWTRSTPRCAAPRMRRLAVCG